MQPNFSPARTYQSVSTHSEVLLKADQVTSVMRRAFHALKNGRPGPVIVEIPADIGPQEVPDPAMNYQPPKRSPQSPAQSDVRDAVKLLLGAKKPVIWSGMGVLLGGASDVLRELAELAEVPVYCTMPGKSGFDERHPLSLGSGSGATGLHARTWLQESDVLLALGSSMTRTSYGQPIPDGKVIIHNTESIEDINKDYTVDVGLPGDAKLTIKMLIDEVKAQAGENGRRGQTGSPGRDSRSQRRLVRRMGRRSQFGRDAHQHLSRDRRTGAHARPRQQHRDARRRRARATPSCPSTRPPRPTATSAGARRPTWATASR